MEEEMKSITAQERADRIKELTSIIHRSKKEIEHLEEEIANIAYTSLIGRYFKESGFDCGSEYTTYKATISTDGDLIKSREVWLSKDKIIINTERNDFAAFSGTWVEISEDQFKTTWNSAFEKVNKLMIMSVEKSEGRV